LPGFHLVMHSGRFYKMDGGDYMKVVHLKYLKVTKFSNFSVNLVHTKPV